MKDILLVSDVRDWAYDVTWKGLKPYFDFDVAYTSDTPRITPEMVKKYRRTHFFNWLGGQQYTKFDNVSGGVTQHNFEIKWWKQAKKYIPRFGKMIAISPELYSSVYKLNQKTTYIPNGVDEKLFKPNNKGGEFTVGWCGQKTSGGFGEKKAREGKKKWDIKGYELILKPLMERLEGKVKFKINCRNHEDALSREEMAEWYRDIDVFICTSIFEGGPLPVLEAASSGKAIISTKVGITPFLINHLETGYLIEKPKKKEELSCVIDKFVDYISYLKDNRQLAWSMGKFLRIEIEKKWTWEKIAPLWKCFFE